MYTCGTDIFKLTSSEPYNSTQFYSLYKGSKSVYDAEKDCLDECKKSTDATGCEVNWSSDIRTISCYRHTNWNVDHGSGSERRSCWPFKKCKRGNSTIDELYRIQSFKQKIIKCACNILLNKIS